LTTKYPDVADWLLKLVLRQVAEETKIAACEVLQSLFDTADAGWLSGDMVMGRVRAADADDDDSGSDSDDPGDDIAYQQPNGEGNIIGPMVEHANQNGDVNGGLVVDDHPADPADDEVIPLGLEPL